MTSPISGFQSCKLIDPLNYFCLQITGPAEHEAIGEVFAAAKRAGLIRNGTKSLTDEGWLISTTDKNGVQAYVTDGDYIVIGVNKAGEIASIALYADDESRYADTPRFSQTLTR